LKFVIWDILVYNGEYLLGKTFLERMQLLEELYPCVQMRVGESFESYVHLCTTPHKNIYKAPCYDGNFDKLYKSIVDTDLYEGLVLKRKDAKLSYGLTEKNNNDWQIKCRKPTKNYDF
jgi:ATP-dependent DNA ligase